MGGVWSPRLCIISVCSWGVETPCFLFSIRKKDIASQSVITVGSLVFDEVMLGGDLWIELFGPDGVWGLWLW